MRRTLTALCLVLVVAMGCFRTEYRNLVPPSSPPEVSEGSPVRGGKRWQSFFIFGLAPGQRVFDASDQCGTAENIESIRTRRTFFQGLIAGVAGVYFFNIYSPYDAAVWCKEELAKK